MMQEATNQAPCDHLTFCTGLHRELILSASDHVTAQTVRGPQPETIKDYDIQVDGQIVAEVRGNYLRKRKHFPVNARGQRLRVDVHGTHGLARARLFEVRVYPRRLSC